jgi:hypothetical protein
MATAVAPIHPPPPSTIPVAPVGYHEWSCLHVSRIYLIRFGSIGRDFN